MPKGRPRLTLKKKRTNQARVRLGRDKDAPTADEWAIMHQYRTFQVSDEDRNEFDFSIDDFARVLPNKREVGEPIETYEYWVCRILDVRAKDVTDVWVQVEWLYSAREAAGIDRKFKASHCGKYERLKSNHVDYVSSSVFDGLVQVKHYDETALDQEPIGADEFYYRYTVDIIKKSISPIPRATCVCGSLDNLTTPVMHFCPQPACRKYYHSSCIVSPSTTAFRDRLDFLLADPDTGAPLQLPLNESASAGPPTKRRRASHAAIPSPNPMGLGPLLAALPPALIRAAAQPIVRGGILGVAGNVAAVVAARRVVCGALREGTAAEGWEKRMPEGWEKTMPPGWDEEEVVLGAAGAENGVLTPKAKISASSRGSKRKGTKGNGKAKTSVMVVLDCPACGGPI